MEKKNIDVPKFQVDDFFTTQEQRDENEKEKIENIELSLIDNFVNHPFKVVENEELRKLEESINSNGVLEPIIVRQKEDRYEILSGHRRKYASELIGNKTIPCIVRNMSDEDAIVFMVDSNMHREFILPSEKAKAYKMKYDAIKKQGKRTDITSGPMGQKLNSRELLSQTVDDSARQIQRYIRLNELIPELLDMVDNSVINETPAIALRPAVELSYLKKEEQLLILDAIGYSDATPSHAQTIKIRKLSEVNKLTEEMIEDIMFESKPNQIQKIKLNEDKIRDVIPKNLRINNMEDFILKACEFYGRHLNEKSKSER